MIAQDFPGSSAIALFGSFDDAEGRALGVEGDDGLDLLLTSRVLIDSGQDLGDGTRSRTP